MDLLKRIKIKISVWKILSRKMGLAELQEILQGIIPQLLSHEKDNLLVKSTELGFRRLTQPQTSHVTLVLSINFFETHFSISKWV